MAAASRSSRRYELGLYCGVHEGEVEAVSAMISKKSVSSLPLHSDQDDCYSSELYYLHVAPSPWPSTHKPHMTLESLLHYQSAFKALGLI